MNFPWSISARFTLGPSSFRDEDVVDLVSAAVVPDEGGAFGTVELERRLLHALLLFAPLRLG